THYETLNVPRTATHQEIRAQFYKLSKKYHPDVVSSVSASRAKFEEISQAYSILGNAGSRKEYDVQLNITINSTSSQANTAYYASTAPTGSGWGGRRSARMRTGPVRSETYNPEYRQSQAERSYEPRTADPSAGFHRTGDNNDVPHFDFEAHRRQMEKHLKYRERLDHERRMEKQRREMEKR
ncbi:DnaJ domain-containing protein, partial [Dipodascopsis tothii]|uniref:DnaJ domain-containing protein n=1 Tax=Dipodascopsis tothii TaxID=44089 RepID=UPI0034CE5DE7